VRPLEHLVNTGCRRIWFVGGPLSIRQVADRLDGLSRVAAAAGDVSVELVETTDLNVQAGLRASSELLQRERAARPDAVFAANDLVALGLLQGLVASRGVRVPDDLSVVGYDDVDFAAAGVVPLTSVRQPGEEVGSAATNLLLEIAGGRGLPSRTSFISRSCKSGRVRDGAGPEADFTL
jgi:LacI family transcriptional regulator